MGKGKTPTPTKAATGRRTGAAAKQARGSARPTTSRKAVAAAAAASSSSSSSSASASASASASSSSSSVRASRRAGPSGKAGSGGKGAAKGKAGSYGKGGAKGGSVKRASKAARADDGRTTKERRELAALVSLLGADANHDARDALSAEIGEPSSLADFKVSRIALSRGHTSEVFSATRRATGERLVLKVMNAEQRQPGKPAFETEVRLLGLLTDAPHVIRLLGHVDEPDTRAIALEFFGNALPLKGLTRLADVRMYMGQLAQALAACHARGIVHRDVKPGNVLYAPRARVLRLIDFGYAVPYEHGVANENHAGTPSYKPPEEVLHSPIYDYSVDVWAFGVMLVALVLPDVAIFDASLLASDNSDKSAQRWQRLMVRIVEVLGLDDYERFVAAYNQETSQYWAVRALAPFGAQRRKRVDLVAYADEHDEPAAAATALAVADAVLQYLPRDRPKAAELTDFAFFAEGSDSGSSSGSSRSENSGSASSSGSSS